MELSSVAPLVSHLDTKQQDLLPSVEAKSITGKEKMPKMFLLMLTYVNPNSRSVLKERP
ncbi:hypothetical protein UY3_07291 [Chelonia mydas]|uniref:Uncharacterized protein n=1 Tax=Chelonia mydas TaxID=8469 RepID=M7BIN1_CHEMY|nr:hypothetical protein UY3_07291 [Chelonia mydas]